MLTAEAVISGPFDPIDTITLDETDRHRRRIKLTSDHGIEFLLNLPKARLLRHEEGLALDDGTFIQVLAKPEKLLAVKGKDAQHLLALVWQIGNRHLAAQIEKDRILIRSDEVIRNMLEQLDAEVSDLEAPFSPEGGAYGDAHQDHHKHD